MERRFALGRLLSSPRQATEGEVIAQGADLDSDAATASFDTTKALPENTSQGDRTSLGPLCDLTEDDSDGVVQGGADGEAGVGDGRQAFSASAPSWPALLVVVLIVTALAGMAGWFGYRAYQVRGEEQQQAQFLEVARQGAVNLATIDYTDVETQVQRMLSNSAGTFLNDFQTRAPGFIDFVKKAKSQTHGSVRESGLEAIDGNEAKVLVAMSVNVGAAGAPADERRWRMRVTVQKADDGAIKVSNVEFVP